MFYDCMYIFFLCTVRGIFYVVCMADDYFYFVEMLKAFSMLLLLRLSTADSNSALRMILLLNWPFYINSLN